MMISSHTRVGYIPTSMERRRAATASVSLGMMTINRRGYARTVGELIGENKGSFGFTTVNAVLTRGCGVSNHLPGSIESLVHSLWRGRGQASAPATRC